MPANDALVYAKNMRDTAWNAHQFDTYSAWGKEVKKLIHAQREDDERRSIFDDLLAACKAFVEAYEKSHQLEKTDVAVRMARAAIERATEK